MPFQFYKAGAGSGGLYARKVALSCCVFLPLIIFCRQSGVEQVNPGNLSAVAPSNLTGTIFARVVFLLSNFASDFRASTSKLLNPPAGEHIFIFFLLIHNLNLS